MPEQDWYVRASETVSPAVALGVALVVAVHQLRAPRPAANLLGALAVVLVLLGFAYVLPPASWFATFPLLVAVFPDGRFVPRWMVVPVVVSAVLTAGDIRSGGAWSELPWWPTFATAQTALLLAQVHRYRRRSTTAERQAVRWVILGSLLTGAAFATVQVAFGSIGVGSAGAVVGAHLATLPLVLCLGGAVLAPRRVDVDRALYVTLAALVVVPLLALVYAVLGALLGGWAGAIGVGAASPPVVLAGRRIADWVVYRGRPSADAAVSRLLARLAERAADESVPGIVLGAVTDALRLDGGGIRGDWFEPVGSPAGSRVMEVPVDYRGAQLATLTVPPRPGETALTRRDLDVVVALARHAAPALHGDRAAMELAESRQRVIAAREEERRRLRRDLHDDLGPALSGLSLSAAALARRTGLPEAGEMHEDVKRLMVQSRELAYGLRPPILDDHGLVAAIVDRTTQPSAPGTPDLDVRVLAPDELDLPAAVDLAALAIVGEAVSNARRHARARCVDVEITLDDRALHVVVQDDGTGLPPATRAGVGMHSIAERAAEVGGEARYDGAARGTRLVVVLPLELP
ncbi:hypothetical protein G7072_06150 [Nocardioides sp. HDW12B]|uniref:sensor histidine kinase n=1 Tax=Nocardioides sp. HDW12B TaxID=2714939 RepID=UPI00140841D8|nr:ATP-binding protein [Nocardioides sp. HDW12B]QIK65975.1 hypothetical protein G7072_06150 [Nocardioides sp. HDW12B]